MRITISERIQLHKLGYSREDIDALLLDPEPEIPAEAVPAEAAPVNNNDAVLAAIDSLKMQMQQMAIMNSNNPAANNEETTFDILNNLINNVKGGK